MTSGLLPLEQLSCRLASITSESLAVRRLDLEGHPRELLPIVAEAEPIVRLELSQSLFDLDDDLLLAFERLQPLPAARWSWSEWAAACG